jgi:serine/threonine protein kinase
VGGRFRLVQPVRADDPVGAWRAIDQLAGDEVVLKPLGAYPVEDMSARGRFRLAAEAVLELSGPGIAEVLDFGEAPLPDGLSAPYLVRRLVSGRTLDQRLGDGPLASGDVLRIVAAVAGALAVAHRAGVVHGHVVPANIMLGSDHVTVTDFGMSALDYRRFGAPSGVLSAVAPELADGGLATPASDMYALGVVFVACLAGITSAVRVDGSVTAADVTANGAAVGLDGARRMDSAAPLDAARLDAAPLGDSAFDDSAFDDSAFDDSAFDDSAFDDSAFDDSALDDSALDDSALDDSAFEPVPAGLASLWAACLRPSPMDRPTAAHAAALSRQLISGSGREPVPELSSLAGAGPDPDAPGTAKPPGVRRPRSRRRRLIAIGGIAAAAAAVVALLVSSLAAQRVNPASSATADRSQTGAPATPGSAAAGQSSTDPLSTDGPHTDQPSTGGPPTPDATSSILSSAPAVSLSPLAVIGRISQTVSKDVAGGQMRSDVGVDLNNLIQPVQTELAAGEQAPVAQLAGTLRAKLQTRLGEGAVSAAAVQVLDGELSTLQRSASG